MKVIFNTPGDDLTAWIGVAGVAVGVLLTTVVEWLRDRRGLARERRRELLTAADELANSANSIGFLMSLFAAQQKEAKALVTIAMIRETASSGYASPGNHALAP